MRVLITGASGFIGCHVLRQLHARGWQAVAVGRRIVPSIVGEMRVALPQADDAQAVRDLITRVAPQVIIHLAGMVAASPVAEVYRANVVYAANILDAASAMVSAPIVLLVGSAAEYGPVPNADLPVAESFPCAPSTPYGISKLAQTLHGLSAVARGLPVIVARMFNPIGPGMAENLALGSFARQIACMGPEGGTLRTGDINVERDFIDVREAVRLLIALIEKPQAVGGVTNICTGYGWNLADATHRLIQAAGMPIRIEQDKARHGASTFPRFVGSPAKLHDMGLSVSLPDMDALMAALLEDARAKRR